jgi:predicted ribosome quality control (RQC) complex YloA/Tae2 family protein
MQHARLSSLEVAAIARDLRFKLVNARLANVSTVATDSRTYQFKFSISEDALLAKRREAPHVFPDAAERSIHLYAGPSRLHTSRFAREKTAAPNDFCMRVRKLLRTARVENVVQFMSDRVVLLSFGQGAKAMHLIFELFAAGNIILVDADFSVLASARRFEDVRAGGKFDVTSLRQVCPTPSPDAVLDAITAAAASGADNKNYREVLAGAFPVGTALIARCLTAAGLGRNVKVRSRRLEEPDVLQAFTSALSAAMTEAFARLESPLPTPGLLYLQEGAEAPFSSPEQPLSRDEAAATLTDVLADVSFFPVPNAESTPVVYLPSFDAAIDVFFSAAESTRHSAATGRREAQIKQRVESIRADSETRMQQLLDAVEARRQAARLVEAHALYVDAICAAFAGAAARGLDWSELRAIVTAHARAGDPAARLVAGFRLATDEIVLSLPLPEDPTSRSLVPVKFALSAFANARRHYDAARAAAAKAERTSAAAVEAVSRAEERAQSEVMQARKAADLSAVRGLRRPLWCEARFRWFVSSEDLLVLLGRDAHTNEALVKRYLQPNELYIHADVHGAASCVIKNKVLPDGTVQFPGAATIQEAGAVCTSCSKAWSDKSAADAYWVWGHQVSKTAQSGEYLPTGSFIVRGQRNPIRAPASLSPLCAGLLFRVDPESFAARHAGERSPRVPSSLSLAACEAARVDAEAEDKAFLASLGINMKLGGPQKAAAAPTRPTKKLVARTGKSKAAQRAEKRAERKARMAARQALQDAEHAQALGAEFETLESESEESAAADESLEPAQTLVLCLVCGSAGHTDKECPQLSELTRRQRERFGTDTSDRVGRRAARKMDEEDRAAVAAAEGLGDADATEPAGTEALPCLTATPHPDDTIISVHPCLVPWTYGQNWAFRVKVVAGTGKKGHAARMARRLLFQQVQGGELATAVPHAELLTDADIVHVLPSGTCDVQAPGVDKLKKADRRAKDAQRAERKAEAQKAK